MENNDNIVMSRYAFERMQAKDERNDRWRNIIIIVLIVLLAATNGAWLWAWNQYDYTSTETHTEVNADNGTANYIGNNGDINNGKDNSDKKNENTGA